MTQPLLCPTEAQVFALLGSLAWHARSELLALSNHNGCTPFENVMYAVQSGAFTWREFFDAPEYCLAIRFDDWREDFPELREDYEP